MAILKECRRRGIGAAILKALIDAAERRGDREIALSAQLHAVEFYRMHGFEPVGDVYEEAGIPHQAMVRALA
jgi:predicted GNAT family N-acyltransferase